MTDFLNSVKADLVDRRLLPIVALVSAAMVAAIAFAVLSGGSSPAPTAGASVPAPVTVHGGLAVSQTQTSTTEAVAETTNGTSNQHGGKAHNPFTPLPGSVKTTSKSSPASASSSAPASAAASSSPSSSSSSSSSGASTPSTPPKTSKPSKPKTAYNVALLFGIVPAGTPASAAELQPYENVKLQTPLPEEQPLIIYRGVTAGGKRAAFTVYGEVILGGAGTCVPSASQCQVITVAPGASEQLQYLAPSGEVITYELRIVSIVPAAASAASAASVLRQESTAGRRLLKEAGLLAVPGMHYSGQTGVLAFVARRPPAARRRFRARIAQH